MKGNTKYSDIFNHLCTYISQHELKSGDKLPTEYELSEQFGVSRVTVRRAIKELVEKDMAYKIQGSGTFVGSLDVHNDFSNFGVAFVTSYLSPSFGDMISGAENYLLQHSCYLTVHCSNQTPATERRIINHLIEKDVRSIIISPVRSNHNNDLYAKLISNGVNLIFTDIYPNGIMANCVSSDNISAGYIATKHLIDKGYIHIASFSHNDDCYTSARSRVAGYKFALKEAGISVNDNYIYRIETLNDIHGYIDRIMSLPVRPQAIVACNDIIAANLMIEAERFGLSVPEDLAIVGMDNSEFGAMQKVPLTSVSQDFYRIGQTAAAMCIEHHKNPNMEFEHKYVPVSLVERESTGKTLNQDTFDRGF